MTRSVQLKICGVTRVDDLQTCADFGVDFVGINLWPGSRRHLDLERASKLVGAVASRPRLVGVFVDPPEHELVEAYERLGLSAVQLHGDAPPQRYAALGIPYVWVIRGTPALASLVMPTPCPAWILLDAQVAGYGGAGTRTDWQWARAAVQSLAPVPVWLAGGIDHENARQAVEQVGPAGLDVASGAEPPNALHGEKDPERIAALVSVCKSCDKPERS